MASLFTFIIAFIIIGCIFGFIEACFDVIDSMWKRSPSAFVSLIGIAMACATALYIAKILVK